MPTSDHRVLMDELRRTAPPAPDALRQRIEAIAAAEPARAPSWRERLSIRRAALIALPTATAALLAVAVVAGVDSAFEPTQEAALEAGARDSRPKPANKLTATTTTAGAALSTDRAILGPVPRTPPSSTETQAERASGASAPPPAKGRAQEYLAELTVRVPDVDALSARTQRAIRLTRGWGGFVVSADFEAPGSEGTSSLVLRVPVGRVQKAVAELSALGVLAAQDVSIRDVQGTLDAHTRRLFELNERIATLKAELASPDLTGAGRADLEAKLARAQRQVAEVRAAREALARRAAFATIGLTLTTADAAEAVPARPGRIERAARDAGSVLAREVAWILYAAIVAAPFLLLAGAGAVAVRVARRRADERLLGRA